MVGADPKKRKPETLGFSMLDELNIENGEFMHQGFPYEALSVVYVVDDTGEPTGSHDLGARALELPWDDFVLKGKPTRLVEKIQREFFVE